MSEAEKKAQQAIDSVMMNKSTTKVKIRRLNLFLGMFLLLEELAIMGNESTEDLKKAIVMIEEKIAELKTS